jgi:hypothetical protein
VCFAIIQRVFREQFACVIGAAKCCQTIALLTRCKSGPPVPAAAPFSILIDTAARTCRSGRVAPFAVAEARPSRPAVRSYGTHGCDPFGQLPYVRFIDFFSRVR